MQLTNSIAFIWYDYTYSPLGFLTEAKFSSSYAALGFSCSYTYDRQGNILTSCQESQPYNTLLFTMGYTYEGNQLLSIDRVLPGALPYEPLSVSDFTERGKFEPVEEAPLAKRNLYDANGNLVYDRGRGLTIDYNLIDRPERIVTQSGDTVYYVYTAMGEKLSEIYRSRDGLSDLRRDFAGVHEMTDGRFTQLNLQQGYIDSIGTLHIYVPDFQGNVIGVVNSRTHQLEQQTDYYPYGQPHPDALGAEVQRRKYGGKELLTELGLDEYDFAARRLAPCGSFTQPDPMATKYPWLSPYAYCAGDPINYVDPTGEVIDVSNLSEEEMLLYNVYLGHMNDNSETFPTLYGILEESDVTYTVKVSTQLSNDGVDIGGSFDADAKTINLLTAEAFDEETGEVVKSIGIHEATEEFFHAFQNENQTLYAVHPDGAEANLEMEAGLYAAIACPMGFVKGPLADFKDDFTYNRLSADKIVSGAQYGAFINSYFGYQNKFIDSYSKTNANIEYRRNGQVPPISLLKLFNIVYKK